MVQASDNFKTVSGIVSKRYTTAVLHELQLYKVSTEDISVVVPERTDSPFVKQTKSTKTPEGIINGVNGLVNAIVGGFTLVGPILGPGMGVFVAGALIGHPLAGALAGAAAGATAGILIGALVNAGVPEEEARYYEDALRKEDNAMIIVRVSDSILEQIKDIFDRYSVKSFYPAST